MVFTSGSSSHSAPGGPHSTAPQETPERRPRHVPRGHLRPNRKRASSMGTAAAWGWSSGWAPHFHSDLLCSAEHKPPSRLSFQTRLLLYSCFLPSLLQVTDLKRV